MQVVSNSSNNLAVTALPDGSKLIVDRENENVFALNATAGAAWDACVASSTLSEVTERMQRSLAPEVTEELAEQAIFELEEKKLVATSSFAAQTSRRRMLGTLGTAIALPLVVSITFADQKAYAQNASSNGIL